MPVYVIVALDVKDQELYEQYKPHVPALVHKHGGKYVARGGSTEVIEGSWHPGRLVVLWFPDAASAHGFFDDPDYQSLRAIRHRASSGQIVMVEGLE